MDNKLIEIQEIVFNQLKRLDDNDTMRVIGAEEIARSNVISNNAQTFIKSINMQLKIMEYADRNKKQVKAITKDLGLLKDESL
jgi:hypothetical protein